MKPRDVQIAIENMIVHGHTRGGTRALRAAVTQHLEAILQAGGGDAVLAGATGAVHIPRLTLELPSGLDADAAGAHIARGIHTNLGSPTGTGSDGGKR